MVMPHIGTDTLQNSGQGTVAGSGLPVSSGKQRSCLASQLRKTKMCVFHLKGICERGNDCTFAHSDAELQSSPDLYKTRLCPGYHQGGCDNKDCPFAHGEEELRSTNIFYKKTLCIWNEKGKCRSGDKCRFAHGTSELHQRRSRCQGSHGATPASARQVAAKGSNETKILQEPMEVLGAGCLPAPQPAEPPATVLAQACERDQTRREGGAPSPTTHSYSMVPQMPSMPGAGIASELDRICGDILSFARTCNEIQMQMEATSPNLSQAYLRDADPITVGSHLEAATGLVVEPTIYWL
mmetsp:Transcript_36039/g.103599  ORF Transcript_36039/g.103599 Transcript_36039/m.103599 type:complete len:296 (+) Transcript_36039:58-945(+)